jgi:hypothetical protein
MRALPTLVAVGALLAVSQAHAQYYGPFGGYSGGYHASTYEEGVQRGMADVIRSAGAANLMNSEAANNYEEARSKYINNRLSWTNTYFEMKRVNKEYRDANRAPRPTSEQLFRLAKESAPKKMNAAELDPVTGKIDWPLILQDESFDTYRNKIDELATQRAANDGQLTLAQIQEAEHTLKDMQVMLKRQINDMPPQTFSSANAFLTRLLHECRRAY